MKFSMFIHPAEAHAAQHDRPARSRHEPTARGLEEGGVVQNYRFSGDGASSVVGAASWSGLRSAHTLLRAVEMLSRFFMEPFGRAQSLGAARGVARPSRRASFMASSAEGVGVFMSSKIDGGVVGSSASTLTGSVPSPARATTKPTRTVFPPNERVCFRPIMVARL